MHSKYLEAYLAARTSRSPSFLDQIGRSLRNAGMLPSGSRGKNAPQLGAVHAARFVIAAAMANSAPEAPDTVKLYGALVGANPFYRFPGQSKHNKQLKFVAALTSIFSSAEAPAHINYIKFRRWPEHADIAYNATVEITWWHDLSKPDLPSVTVFAPLSAYKLGKERFLIHKEISDRLMVDTVTIRQHFIKGVENALHLGEWR